MRGCAPEQQPFRCFLVLFLAALLGQSLAGQRNLTTAQAQHGGEPISTPRTPALVPLPFREPAEGYEADDGDDDAE